MRTLRETNSFGIVELKNSLPIVFPLLIFVFTGLALNGCSSSTKHEVDEKLSQEPQLSSTSELAQETDLTLKNAPGLTAEQKQKLFILRDSTRMEISQLRDESLKLRSLLAKEIVATQYNADEVGNIKSRLRKVENQRLDAIFNATDKANTIIGRKNIQSMNRYFNEIIESPIGTHDF